MNVLFCPRGHDKRIVGLHKGGCRQCHKLAPSIRNLNFNRANIRNPDGSKFTYLDYDHAYQRQQGRCLGCHIHQLELPRKLDADHDHKTGVFRFLLCQGCNKALGGVKDSPEVLRRLANLLETPKQDI